MQISDLPEEILVDIISKKLDFKSIYNLYETCPFFKNIIHKYNVVKTADLALGTVATMQFLKQDFMKDVSRYLHNLDLRGVVDVNKTSLLAAVGGMKSLKSLDVSYTNITLYDMFKVYKICPTIKNLACNFVFGKKKNINASIPECEDLFQNLEKVHLVGNAGNMIYSNLAMWVLRKAHLSQLQLSIVENCSTVYGNIDEPNESNIDLNFKFISIGIVNEWKIPNSDCATIFCLPSLLHNEDKYECIVIITDNCNKNQIYMSPIFKNFFQSYNAMDIDDINFFKHIINGVIMFWDKESNVFDDIFFNELKTKMEHLLPYNIRDDSTVVPKNVDRFYFGIPLGAIRSNLTTDTLNLKKKRCAPEPYLVNFDTVLVDHKEAHLTLLFPTCSRYPATISPNSQYLRKLQYLNLSGFVRCPRDFFNTLFRCCEQLETLNIEDSPFTPNVSVIARNVPLSRSLKNLRLANRKIDFDMLFTYLSQCSTLENIHILDNSPDNNDLGDPSTLFEKCTNLYCIFIYAAMSTAGKTRANQLFKKLKNKYRKCYMRVELCTGCADTRYNYDPYVDVFNVNELRPIEKLY